MDTIIPEAHGPSVELHRHCPHCDCDSAAASRV